MVKAATEQGLIPRNPADEVDAPKVIRKQMNILTDEQLDIFMEAIRSDEIWYDFFYTELTTGLRLGEICGLMWSDFDNRSGTRKISRTLHKEKGGRLIARNAKTYAGNSPATIHHQTPAGAKSQILLAMEIP